MPGSCALSCHVALEWAGAEYEAVRLTSEETKEDAFLAINPKGKVPALKLDGGEVVTEALAILSHIAHAHPDTEGLLPPADVPRVLMLEALSELTGEFHPAFAPLHVPGRYTSDEAGHDAVKNAARTRIRGHYDRWNERIRDRNWVLETGRSAVDPYLYVMCRWAGMIEADLTNWPALSAFAARIEAQDRTRVALDAEGVDPIVPDASRAA